MTRNYDDEDLIRLSIFLTGKEKEEFHRKLVGRFTRRITDEEFDEYSNKLYERLKKVETDGHHCEKMVEGDVIKKWKAGGWRLELDEGINVTVLYCHCCGVKFPE